MAVTSRYVLVLLLLLVTVRWSQAAELLRLRSVEIDPSTTSVITTGWVNQVIGNLELLACGPGGKTHESIFVLNVNPIDLNAGFLLLGIEPGTDPTGLGQGNPDGPGVEIWVDWEVDGEKKTERAERFIIDLQTKKVLPKIAWLYTGSVIEEGEFRAVAEESLVATYWDPWAILNIPLAAGTNDDILVVNKEATPPLGTPVTLRFKVQTADDPIPLR